MKEHFDGIWAEWNGDGILKAVLPRFYMREAPANAAMPYGVFWRVTEGPDRTFGVTTYDQTRWQVDAYANEWDATVILDIDTKLRACFDRCVLTVAGYLPIVMLWEFTEGPLREDDCWHLVQQYYSEVRT